MTPMDLISLPTDSLYKFMAFTGLFITVFSLTYPLQLHRKIGIEIRELVKDTYSLEAEVNNLREDLGIFKTRYQSFKSKLKVSAIDPNIIPEEHEEQFRDIEDQQINMAKLSNMIESKQKLTNFKADQLEAQKNLQETIGNASVIGILIGSLLALSGFYFWYTRIQVYLDNAISQGLTP